MKSKIFPFDKKTYEEMCQWVEDLWIANDVPELIYVSEEQAKYMSENWTHTEPVYEECECCGQMKEVGTKEVKPNFDWRGLNVIDTDYGVFKLELKERK